MKGFLEDREIIDDLIAQETGSFLIIKSEF
jgi:hypothetical protein